MQGWVAGTTNAAGVNGPFFTFADNSLGGSSSSTPACGDDECFTTDKICVSGTLDEDDSGWAAVALGLAYVDGVEQAYSTTFTVSASS